MGEASTTAQAPPPTSGWSDSLAEHLERLLGGELRCASTRSRALAEAEIVVVGPPARWGCFWWWRSHCGRMLRRARTPVVVAARSDEPPKRLRTCLLAIRRGPLDPGALPRWLRRFETLELVIAHDHEGIPLLPATGGPPYPALAYGAAPANDAAVYAERAVAACRRRYGEIARVQFVVGPLIEAIAEVCTRTRVDAICLVDGTAVPDFGRTLRSCVDTLRVPVIVPPRAIIQLRSAVFSPMP